MAEKETKRRRVAGFFKPRGENPADDPNPADGPANSSDTNNGYVEPQPEVINITIGQSNNPSSGDNATRSTITDNNARDCEMDVDDTNPQNNNEATADDTTATDETMDDVVVINNRTVTDAELADQMMWDVCADLDYDDSKAAKKGSDDGPDDQLPGIQQTYVKEIQKRLQKEVSKDNTSINQWLR